MRKNDHSRQPFTFNEIKTSIEETGYKLDMTKDEYLELMKNKVGRPTSCKLSILCPKNHTMKKSYRDFGLYPESRCHKCTIATWYQKAKTNAEERNFTLDMTEEEFIEGGFRLTKDKFPMICHKEGHKTQKSYKALMEGKGCSECSNRSPKSYQRIKNDIESKGHTLNTSEEEWTKNKIQTTGHLSITCPDNHTSIKSYSDWTRRSCLECGSTARKSYEFVKLNMQVEGYELETTENDYINNNLNVLTPIDIKCPEGHKYKVSCSAFVNAGSRCKQCWLDSRYNQYQHVEIYLRKNTGNEYFINKYLNDDKNYNNWLDDPKKYCVDHIFPLSAFIQFLVNKDMVNNKAIKYYLKEKVINNRINLQLMDRSRNRDKWDKYNRRHFKKYMRSNGYLDEIERLKNEI